MRTHRSVGLAVGLVASTVMLLASAPALAAVPSVQITSPAEGDVTSSSVQVVYSVADAQSTLCFFDGAPIQCSAESGNVPLSGLPDGTHTFEIHASNASEVVADSVTWTVDASGPVVTFTQTPSTLSPDHDPVFRFQVTDASPVTAISCNLDGEVSSCGSGPHGELHLFGLVDGPHQLTVNAVDAVGNVGPMASFDWSIDQDYPSVELTVVPPVDTNSTAATFAYTISAPVGVASKECFLGSALVECGDTGQAFSDLTEGWHYFTVKVVDDNGTEASDVHEWYVDLTPPLLEFTFGPGSLTNAASVSFGLTASDLRTITSVQCALDGGPPQVCTGNPEYFDLTEGPHTLEATATDAAGNTSTESRFWTADLTPPTAALTAPVAAGVTLAGKVPVTWTGSDEHDVELFQVEWRAAGPGSAFGDWQFLTAAPEPGSASSPALAAGSTYCFRVIAYDVPGNETIAQIHCTSSPLDDRGLKASAGWTRGTGTAFYRGTHTSTTSIGRTLSRTGVVAKRLGIVATRCATCGKVAVFLGNSQIGTINLASTTSRHRQIILLPAFATSRSGTVKLKAVSSGKLVRIDGLVVVR